MNPLASSDTIASPSLKVGSITCIAWGARCQVLFRPAPRNPGFTCARFAGGGRASANWPRPRPGWFRRCRMNGILPAAGRAACDGIAGYAAGSHGRPPTPIRRARPRTCARLRPVGERTRAAPRRKCRTSSGARFAGGGRASATTSSWMKCCAMRRRSAPAARVSSACGARRNSPAPPCTARAPVGSDGEPGRPRGGSAGRRPVHGLRAAGVRLQRGRSGGDSARCGGAWPRRRVYRRRAGRGASLEIGRARGPGRPARQ